MLRDSHRVRNIEESYCCDYGCHAKIAIKTEYSGFLFDFSDFLKIIFVFSLFGSFEIIKWAELRVTNSLLQCSCTIPKFDHASFICITWFSNKKKLKGQRLRTSEKWCITSGIAFAKNICTNSSSLNFHQFIGTISLQCGTVSGAARCGINSATKFTIVRYRRSDYDHSVLSSGNTR